MKTELWISFSQKQLPKFSSIAILELRGILDLGQPAIVFHQKIDDLQMQNVNYFILDFSRVTLCHPDWLMIIVDALRNRGGEMPFVNVHPNIIKIFEFLGIDDYLKIYRTEEQALNAWMLK